MYTQANTHGDTKIQPPWQKLMEVNTFRVNKNDGIFHTVDQIQVSRGSFYHFKSGIVIFAGRVTWKYAFTVILKTLLKFYIHPLELYIRFTTVPFFEQNIDLCSRGKEENWQNLFQDGFIHPWNLQTLQPILQGNQTQNRKIKFYCKPAWEHSAVQIS